MRSTQQARKGVAEHLVDDCERLALMPECIVAAPQGAAALQQILRLLVGAHVHCLDVTVQLHAPLAQIRPDWLPSVFQIPAEGKAGVCA
jgi:hypothetical protein